MHCEKYHSTCNCRKEVKSESPGLMKASTQNLTDRVRHFLSRRLIQRVASGSGTKEAFSQSQSWEGYDRACNSWHNAYWKWVDHEAPAELVARLKGLQIEFAKVPATAWSELPCAESEMKSWLVEQTRQEILQDKAVFRLAMRGPEAGDPETYKMFLDDMKVAALTGDNTYFAELAKQKQRKPAKGKGDRRLKPQLLMLWVPGCLWAFSTGGVAEFLNAQYPRSGNGRYNNKTISDACRDLRLYRSPKPLWWGTSGKPSCLVPL
jgi:hypothetical protein